MSKADSPQQLLRHDEMLIFGVPYLFWTFEYLRGNRVYFGRYVRMSEHKEVNGQSKYRYNLGLRPISFNQTWVVSHGGPEGDVVPWNEDIGLSVAGNNPKVYQPDSKLRLLLSATEGRADSWHVYKPFWDTQEQI